MGWFYDVDHPSAVEHEGYVALVLDDGEITSEHSARTRGRVVAWRFACDCGWMHPMSARVPEHLSQTTMAPQAIEASAFAEWQAHIREDVPELHHAWERTRLPVFRDADGIPRPWPHEL